MVTDTDARRLALAVAGAVEQDHHGFPSFRVAGRTFATLPSPDRLRAMLDEHGIRSAAATWPDACCRSRPARRDADLSRYDRVVALRATA